MKQIISPGLFNRKRQVQDQSAFVYKAVFINCHNLVVPSADFQINLSWSYHQILSIEDQSKNFCKNECTLMIWVVIKKIGRYWKYRLRFSYLYNVAVWDDLWDPWTILFLWICHDHDNQYEDNKLRGIHSLADDPLQFKS